MKMLHDLLGRYRRHFAGEGKLRVARPVFDATENFFFGPEVRTSDAPHIRDPLDVKRFMATVIIALLPCVAASVYFFGLRVLLLIAVSYAAGGAVEVLFAVLRKEEINEGFLVTGLIFPLILPPGLPLWMAALGVMLGVTLGKELFGGTGRNLFNPALLGRCILAVGYPAAMAGSWISPGGGVTGRLFEYAGASGVDAVSSATPLALARAGELADTWQMLTGRVGGSAGETSAIAIVAGGLFLLLTRVANWRTVAAILGSFAALAILINAANPERFAPAGWQLAAGGLLFGAFFMATDPVTSPLTNGGKWIYGAFIGITALLIRNLTGYVEGVMFAILLGNIFAPLIDEAMIRVRLRRLRVEG